MKESGTYIMLCDNVNIQEKSISQIARETGMSRNTIKKYLREGEKPHRSKGRHKKSKLDGFKPTVLEMMKAGIYNAEVVLERIREEGYDGEVSILRDYMRPLRPPALKTGPAVMRYETKPGKQAQMDWGIMKYRDPHGKISKVACFVMILAHSRFRYVEFSRRCDESSLLRCIVNAFEYFGGIPEIVLTDRMKTVVVSTDHGKPVWQETFERFATEMGFIPKLCRVRRPQTKGKVERLVHYVRDNFMAGRHFRDYGDLQRQAVFWCEKVNGRIHGTTGERPIELLREETLQALPHISVMRPYVWEERKVARDCFVSYNGTRYGVGWKYSGQIVRIRSNGNVIAIADNDYEVIQQHQVCHQARKHIFAKGQYDGFAEQDGKPYTPPYGIQIPSFDVEIRPLSVYENLMEVV